MLGTTQPLVQGDRIPEELRELGRSWGSALIRTNLQPGSPALKYPLWAREGLDRERLRGGC